MKKDETQACGERAHLHVQEQQWNKSWRCDLIGKSLRFPQKLRVNSYIKGCTIYKHWLPKKQKRLNGATVDC